MGDFRLAEDAYTMIPDPPDTKHTASRDAVVFSSTFNGQKVINVPEIHVVRLNLVYWMSHIVPTLC